ncbi:hypothetical protein M758_10G115800 [Ceratodon purpureus]|nr:hypothetical protein M758_10G115800 [Ceratodon purpureus]
MASAYTASFGVKCERRDRFDGEPSWVDTVIREYEVGILGPTHNCKGYCDCISCVRLAWIQRPTCWCSFSAYRVRSLSLDDAMRPKWTRCRCSPPSSLIVSDKMCLCILLLPTQEWVPTPSSSYSLPSDLLQTSSPRPDLDRPLMEREVNALMRIVERLEEEGRRFTANGFSSHGTELILNEGTTVLLSDLHGTVRSRAERGPDGTESETDDTACSTLSWGTA